MKMKKNLLIKLAILMLSLNLWGCEAATHVNSNNDSATDKTSVSSSKSKNNKSDTNYSLDNLPEFNGEPYVELDGNMPKFDEQNSQTTKPFENYSELDKLGRCQTAYANICKEIQPTQEREKIGQVKPTGWQTVKYKGLVDGNYLYNRCHLIGYQLAGENANEKNLITGTRYLNVTGMLPFENMVDEYVEKTKNHVLYRVTPVFEGNNLVASGVQMEGWSVEDNGKGICFNVYCFNVQPGIVIDYSTGKSHEDKSGYVKAETKNNKSSEKNSSNYNDNANNKNNDGNNSAKQNKFVINKSTLKFHLQECNNTKSMKEENKETVNSTVDELKKQGYSPCKNCIK